MVLGSSPLTRGAPPGCISLYFLQGIIPAYAGSTKDHSGAILKVWDHPRLRGEHSQQYRTQLVPVGSSPLTRGARYNTLVCEVNTGIIPAYAGSTRISIATILNNGDHPRLRGEHQLS